MLHYPEFTTQYLFNQHTIANPALLTHSFTINIIVVATLIKSVVLSYGQFSYFLLYSAKKFIVKEANKPLPHHPISIPNPVHSQRKEE